MNQTKQKPIAYSFMFPAGNNFNGGAMGPIDPFGGDGLSGPPPSDSVFDAMADFDADFDEGALLGEISDASSAQQRKNDAFLAVGLHFFEKIRGF